VPEDVQQDQNIVDEIPGCATLTEPLKLNRFISISFMKPAFGQIEASTQQPIFSSCGNYVVCMEESSLNQPAALIAVGRRKRGTWWKKHPISTDPSLSFKDAKFTAAFDSNTPTFAVTFWARPTAQDSNAVCELHCFSVDIKENTVTSLGEPMTLGLVHCTGNSETCILDHDSWMADMNTMKRSMVISKCGGYIVLSATLGIQRWDKVIEIDNERNQNVKGKSPENVPLDIDNGNKPNIRGKGPEHIALRYIIRVIGSYSTMTYWHQHRYWVSLYKQRVLLHRSARSVEYPDKFSDISCHVQLAIVPSYLGDSETWLLIPESRDGPMKVVLAPKTNPIEIWSLSVSWNVVLKRLVEVENRI
jgi:hypothetical protein